MRTEANWTFGPLLIIILQAIGVYMAAALVLPDITGAAIIDLRDHYFAHKSWFFGALLAGLVFSVAKELALSGHLDRMNLAFQVFGGLMVTMAAITRREWFHKLLAPAFALVFLLYISLLFARLQWDPQARYLL